MESTNGQAICQGHHGRAGWGWGSGQVGVPRQSVDMRAASEATLSTVATAAAPATDTATSGEATNASLHYERQERTSLVIRTQEGDLVKLRFAESEALAVDAGSSGTDDADAGEKTLTLGTSTRISVKIKGDLNDNELGAIRSVIEQAGSLAAEFFNGDAGKAFAMASELSIDSQQLAKVALRMRVHEALTYSGGAAADLPALAGPAAPPVISAHAAPETASAASDAAAVADETASAPAVDPSAAAPASDGAVPGPVEDTAAGEAAAPASDDPSATDAPATDAPATDPAASDPSTALPQLTDPFVAIRSMLDFLTNLIDAFQTDVTTTPAVSDAPADTGSEAASGDDATTGAPTEASLSFSLKLRIFVSLLTTTAAAGSTDGESASDAVTQPGDTAGDAVTTLADAVATIAADSEPGYQAVA